MIELRSANWRIPFFSLASREVCLFKYLFRRENYSI